MRRYGPTLVLVLALLAIAADDPSAKTKAPAGEALPVKSEESGERLSMSTPIACRSIKGFEDYESLPEATLTADEKLLVYYRPSGYHVAYNNDSYRGHLTQDGQIRRRGEKPVLLKKDNLLDYDWKTVDQPKPIFLRNTVSLKGLKPGDYDYDIILHDKLSQGPPATVTLPFKVVAAALPRASGDSDTPGDNSAAAPEPKPKAKSKAKSKGRRPSR